MSEMLTPEVIEAILQYPIAVILILFIYKILNLQMQITKLLVEVLKKWGKSDKL